GTDEQHRRAELVYHVEFALGPIEIAAEERVRHALEIAKGLVEIDAQSKVRRHGRQLFGRPGVRNQVVFEDLDRVEASGRDRFELVAQRSAETDGGNALAHGAAGAKVWSVFPIPRQSSSSL